MRKMLLRSGHGLGDCVQLTSVLRHLKHYYPDCQLAVEVGTGKASAFKGFDLVEPGDDFEVHDLEWPESPTSFKDCPSTKVEYCLYQVFRVHPQSDLWRYRVAVSDEARLRAREYIRSVAKGEPAMVIVTGKHLV